MRLNNEKLPVLNLRFNLKRRFYLRKKRNAEEAHLKKRMEFTRSGLERWIKEGRYRIRYNKYDDLLEELGVTADELNMFCVAAFGKRFLSWRTDIRMEEAKRMLLTHPEIPASRIGLELGISDKADFRHQFKSATGLTPSEWRKNNTENNKEKFGK